MEPRLTSISFSVSLCLFMVRSGLRTTSWRNNCFRKLCSICLLKFLPAAGGSDWRGGHISIGIAALFNPGLICLGCLFLRKKFWGFQIFSIYNFLTQKCSFLCRMLLKNENLQDHSQRSRLMLSTSGCSFWCIFGGPKLKGEKKEWKICKCFGPWDEISNTGTSLDVGLSWKTLC